MKKRTPTREHFNPRYDTATSWLMGDLVSDPLPMVIKSARHMTIITRTHYSISEDETGKQLITQTTFKEAEQGFITIKGEQHKIIWNAKDTPYLLALQLRG